jgi:hypothetical protein
VERANRGHTHTNEETSAVLLLGYTVYSGGGRDCARRREMGQPDNARAQQV